MASRLASGVSSACIPMAAASTRRAISGLEMPQASRCAAILARRCASVPETTCAAAGSVAAQARIAGSAP